MAKKEVKKEEKKEEKKEVVETKTEIKIVDGIFEVEGGYETSIGGVKKSYIGEKLNAFTAALGDYRISKSL